MASWCSMDDGTAQRLTGEPDCKFRRPLARQRHLQMICTTQYHTAAIMQEQYSGTVPQAAGNFGQPMLPWALEDPETSKQDRDLPRLKNSLNSNPIESPSSLSSLQKKNLNVRLGKVAERLQSHNLRISIKMPRRRHGWHVC